MIKLTNVTAPIDFTAQWVTEETARRLGVPEDAVLSVRLLRKSLDARRKTNIHYVLTIGAVVEEETRALAHCKSAARVAEDDGACADNVWTHPEPPVVVGSGPSGLFAALALARAGAKPILLERGDSVEERKQAVDAFWSGGALDAESNVQFGEGGAGTFSDGKLTSGIKDPRVRQVLETLHTFGAPDEVLYDAKPHIGTDLLIGVVKQIREEILRLGGQVIFRAKFVDFCQANGRISHAVYEKNGETVRVATGHLLLATGHSARDVFLLLQRKGVCLAQKAFSLGVRVEHRQAAINEAMYGKTADMRYLPPADYKLAAKVGGGRGVYTFCMCPGGQVVASSSEHGGITTNGMSYHKRDGENANSAVLVGIGPEDFGSADPLAGMWMQRAVEQTAFALSNTYHAPTTTVGAFLGGRTARQASVLPSYRPGVISAMPGDYLPAFLCTALQEGLRVFGTKLRGFDAADAILTGPETRSSSPVRVLRGESGESVSTPGLYPVGEGAGYAGGIISAAVDGIRTAERLF